MLQDKMTSTLTSFVHYLWLLLSVLVAVTCTFCFLQPEWFVHPDFVHSFGVYAFCVRDLHIPETEQRCGFYGGRFGFENVPSTPWQAACLLFGGGCLFLCFSALIAIATMCIRTTWDKSLILVTKYLQIAGVLFLISGLVVYPVGLDSPYFRYYCGSTADSFRSGRCHIGWTYMLAIAGTALSIFCPVLSHFSEENPAEVYDIKYVM